MKINILIDLCKATHMISTIAFSFGTSVFAREFRLGKRKENVRCFVSHAIQSKNLSKSRQRNRKLLYKASDNV